MPHTVDGAKWACEGCIRGHRSNKCEHFQDRWMFRVKKPGRPLQTCPHPDKPCPCDEEAYIMVRIPGGPPGERDACYCQPVRAAQSPQDCRLQTGYPLPWTPRHGSRQNPGPSSAHKPSQTNGADGSDTDRLHSNGFTQQQGRRNGNSMPQGLYNVPAMKIEGQWPTPGYAPMQGIPHQSVSQPPPPTILPQHVSGPTYDAYPQQPGLSIQHPVPFNQHISQTQLSHIPTPAQTPSPPKKGSCCGSRSGRDQTAPNLQQSKSQLSNDDNCHTQQPCSPGYFVGSTTQPDQAIGTQKPLDFEPEWRFPGLNNATLADPFDPRVSSSNRDAEAKVIHSHQDMPNPNTLQQSVPMPDNGCQCGPSCNCVFCTKHPTNEATRGRIGELYSIMDQQPFEESSPSSRPTSSYDGFSMMPSAFESHPGFPNQPLPHDYQLGEPQFNEMDQPDYFEMAYPVGGCANGYCRCGDNCACVGCLTHTGHLPSPLQ